MTSTSISLFLQKNDNIYLLNGLMYVRCIVEYMEPSIHSINKLFVLVVIIGIDYGTVVQLPF